MAMGVSPLQEIGDVAEEKISAVLPVAEKAGVSLLVPSAGPYADTGILKALLDDFAKALCLADVVILADIYAARETDTLGISSGTLAEKIRALGHQETYYLPSFTEIENFVRKNCQKGDVLITMGAGNVNEIAADLLS